MKRSRPIQTGHVYRKGPSWILQWREDVRTAEGKLERKKFHRRLAPLVDEEGKRITKREADRIAWEQVLSKLNQISVYATSLATVEEFWKKKFEPEHIASLKPAGQRHYKYCERKIMPELGPVALREVSHDHVLTLCRHLATESGGALGTQSVLHIRNALSGMFRHALAVGFLTGDNPARGVRLPPMKRKQQQALSFSDAQRLIAAYPSPVKEMVHTSLLTSMNVAELAALRVKHVNLNDEPAMIDGEILPAYSVMVRENYYEGKYSSVKTSARRRIVPLVPQLIVSLMAMIATNCVQGPETHLFQNKVGGVINYHNLARRVLRPFAEKLGITGVSWHVFRRSTATWAELIEMPMSERTAIMGHASGQMTMHYTQADIARRREYLVKMQARLVQ